ncbi:putative N-acetylmannosaminyltransferase [Clostridium pasteurianum DSM 525 = ATCC 6013]|uniref:N-acetylglucosaminyldiphosphoundecaprenol N-acetyl-beta-D-mannosaminyltransferase n=1 Tax=Clostridium pasteurianum DSM 525 = ATCC 6013 TaxID=1262449 RepID=A0A0H3J2U8_CLOPA|nr:WecB/TagA/CpsF family glycosyltransferase [Clostridium pasteurianum]AJA47784.1 putative N-acetylmannosaminyltransferase [Clostridium pasteurianum DSM 525 = ATCC 6013]AJA51772.1 putative N-acetylmannosaminyltransferase [Clostridium pasteurianum DSM 525 = ATCC 6013]AOZ75081.1 UDP-N-acetyl-D-mannosaminuronic acid transferase [Clostridium pasteurianum DSM 525 = ATCC 6013]AOZ78876.1 UDP-N-acetyl-D-mannosaminuronic acid transferase [Clostridium pasteurianum]ELP59685.1 WecB/TagA/CpsF family glycos
MFSKILDYHVFNKSKLELMKYIKTFKKVHIISGNPEVLYNGLYDKSIFKGCSEYNSIIIPDGIGVVIASKIVKKSVEEKIPGIEVMDEIIKYCERESKAIYLLGAKQEIIDECIIKLKFKYSKLQIAGSHNGYFDMNSCEDILQDIKNSKPYAIFVAMGCPRQEKFINMYMDSLPASVYMGVGGSFDVIAGKVNRAPRWMIKFGLEWLYRVAKEPWRIKRLGSIPKLILKVIYNKYIIRKE